LPDLLGIAGAIAQRQEGAIESVGLEVEEAGLVDEPAGLDQVAGTGFALVGFELGFLLGEPGFLLFVGARCSTRERAMGSPLVFGSENCGQRQTRRLMAADRPAIRPVWTARSVPGSRERR
jgi:hypothetical protein